MTWDNEGDAKRFAEEFRLPFAVGRDADGRIGALYGVEATPTTFFIGKDGKLVARVDGAPEDAASIRAGLEQRIDKLLAS